MKKIRLLVLAIGILCIIILNPNQPLAASHIVTRKFDVTFTSKFVLPDGTEATPAIMTPEARIVNQPHYSYEFHKFMMSAPNVLRNTQVIPYIGGGVWNDTYQSEDQYFGFWSQVQMEGFRKSYNSLFIETKACVKGITPIQNIGGNTYIGYRTNGTYTNLGEFKVSQFFENTTLGGRYGFKLSDANPDWPNLCDPQDVLFAASVGGATNPNAGAYVLTYYSEIYGTRKDGTPITFQLDLPEVEETFVDTAGNQLPTSALGSGFKQGNKYYAPMDDSYTFGGGQNGQITSLPSSYTGSNGKVYDYKGWYYGDTLRSGTPNFSWKNISNSDKDKYAKIKIVYKERKQQYKLTGSWVDDTPEANLLPANGYIGTNPGVFNVDIGDDFNGNGSATLHWNITDYSGKTWELQGWKNMSKDPNTLIADNVPKVLDVTEDTNLHYIYKKIAPRLEINLTPDSTVMRKPGETIDWTLEIKNTGYKANATGLDLSHVISKTGGNMTNPSNTVIEDNNGTAIAGITNAVWTDGGTLLASKGVAIKPNEKITVKFNTVVTGDINDLLNLKTKVTATSDNLSAEDDTNVRIEDPDHHVVTDPANSKLSLLYVPTIFGFGYHEKNNNGANQTVTMATGAYQTKTVNEGFYVKLQDPRDNLAGNDWKLSANLDYFIDSSNIILPMQPVLTLDNYTSQVVNNPETDSESISPTSDVSLTTGTVTLTGGGGTVPLMNSQSTKNKGTWIFRIPFNDVKLHIPADVGEEGKGYTSELTWTLNDTI
ncbi:WxL domain-containing protein [Enterococcus sp. DIV0756]|uniref:WxL domain-containing protein n=1 Tax=Enterococcus sp. DIV0756 TaxID=2774636 RepID=UPI003F1FB95B